MTVPAPAVPKADPATGIFKQGFGLKQTVKADVDGDYKSGLVDHLRANDYTLSAGGLTVHLAREFGFCYGVDKAIDFAYQTRAMFPDRRIFLTAEIIHNPRVNRRLLDMGLRFLAGQYADGTTVADLRPDDVVVLPAFGASLEEIAAIKSRGCTVVDTTCGSVVHVWKRVEKYARDGFTSIIHGKHAHEETLATCSRVNGAGGRYAVVLDKTMAGRVCDFIRRAPGAPTATGLLKLLGPGAVSPGFDPERDLDRVGCANQTTMLSTESLEIAAMIQSALADRYGEPSLPDHFRSFDTICSATQERQDAVKGFAGLGLDLVLVIGGFNSSNTTHLIEIAAAAAPAFHIEDAGHLVSADALVHQPPGVHGATATAAGWLPPLPFALGVTAGASTPDRAIGDVVARIAELAGVSGELRAIVTPPPARPQAAE